MKKPVCFVLSQLDKWKKISGELALARIDDATAKKHSKNGKAILWIDGGMHATERAHGQMTAELAYTVVASTSSWPPRISTASPTAKDTTPSREN